MSQPETGNALKSPVVAFDQLREALAASDLEQARESYATVKQYAPAPAGKPDAVSAAFEELGKVLSEGDLGKAQVAFDVMQSMLKANEVAQPRNSEGTFAPAPAPKRVDIVG
jgi:hypothetical protein